MTISLRLNNFKLNVLLNYQNSMGKKMKQTLNAILIMLLSLVGAKGFAASIQLNQVSKITMTTNDGTGPGGNGSVKNGVVKSQ